VARAAAWLEFLFCAARGESENGTYAPGLLGSALYNPVWTSAVRGPTDFAIAAAGFVALIVWRAPPLLVVVATAAAAVALSLAG